MFAIELFFDAATDRAVREVWRELGYKGIRTIAPGSASHPHLTLAVYDRIAQAICAERLAMFVARTDPFGLTLAYLGLLPPLEHEAVVFAGPAVTSELLALHGRVHDLLDDCTGTAHPYYLLGDWVPHCTLAHSPTQPKLGQAASTAAARGRHGGQLQALPPGRSDSGQSHPGRPAIMTFPPPSQGADQRGTEHPRRTKA